MSNLYIREMSRVSNEINKEIYEKLQQNVGSPIKFYNTEK